MSDQIARADAAAAAEPAHSEYEQVLERQTVYLAGLYLRRGRAGPAMPEMRSIDAELDREAERN
jgi:hypothetical protein